MARPSATAALLLLLLVSLLAVAHCRTVAVAADHDTEPESTAAVAVNDAKAATGEKEAGLPAEQHHDFEFLRLPSHGIHQRHRPCSLHRHHGMDRSIHDSDGEGELVSSREPSLFADADGHDGERAAAVKKEMLRRWFHFHHGMRHHHLHHDEEVGQQQAPEDMNVKRLHFHHHDDDEEDEEKNMMRKRLRHAEAEHDGHDEDSDDEDGDVEQMVRRFRKAIMKRRFGHGRRFFHHDHSHRHAEEAEKLAAGGEEEAGVMAWIKGLMNRF